MRYVGRILSSTYILSELSELILQQILKDMKISSGSIVLIREQAIIWTKKMPSQLTDFDSTKVMHLLEACRKSERENVLVFEEITESDEKTIMREYHLSVVLPLSVQDEIIGALLLGEKASGDIYSVEDIGVLKILAPEISLAVKNALSYEEIRKFNATLEKKVNQATDEYKKVNEEVYKKNLELAERNKTLSLLREIDEIVLSTVTDTQQIAQQVANLIVSTTHLNSVIITMVDKTDRTVMELATAPLEILSDVETIYQKSLRGVKVSLIHEQNVIVRAVKRRTVVETASTFEVLYPLFTEEQASAIQRKLNIGQSVVYPLIVRNEVIGAMVLGLDSQAKMTPYQQDLIDRLVGVIGIALDNALLYKTLEDANERLKQIDYLKDEFVSVASHELRTPMTAIRSYLWLALAGKGGALTDKQRYYIERSYNSTTRLIKLVNDMLNVSRIESGRMGFEMQEVDSNTLIQDVIAEVAPRAAELGVKLLFNPIPGLPHVIADPDKIKEVVINFIGNSLKFTPQEGSITITQKIKEDMLQVSVTDTGEGIAADDIPKLFQKFSLVKGSYQTNQRASQGTGLGLYISKSIITEHKGMIWAESPGRGKGATFSFTLKLYNDRELEQLQQAHQVKEGLGIIHTEI